MTFSVLRHLARIMPVLILAGCATPDPEGAFREVDDLVRVRTGQNLVWYDAKFARPERDPRVSDLLSQIGRAHV